MTSHSCTHSACTVSMRTAHRREAPASWALYRVGLALFALACLAAGGMWIGGGL